MATVVKYSSAPVKARAYFIGSRIDVRSLERSDDLAVSPVVVSDGEHVSFVVFRFGVVVSVDRFMSDHDQSLTVFLNSIAPLIREQFDDPAVEEMEIREDQAGLERIDQNGVVVISELSTERLQILADVLAKSAVLSHYEQRVAKVFDHIERIAEQLGKGVIASSQAELLREIGGVLLIQARMVGRVEVLEKPETTWENPELDRLHKRLVVEYELQERDRALSRKLSVVAQTAETYLDLINNQQSRKVEWYIVFLILFEVCLSLFHFLH